MDAIYLIIFGLSMFRLGFLCRRPKKQKVQHRIPYCNACIYLCSNCPTRILEHGQWREL